MLKELLTSNSESGKLNSDDWKKIGRGALIALAPCLITLIGNLTSNINTDTLVGSIATAVAAVALNALRKLVAGKTE